MFSTFRSTLENKKYIWLKVLRRSIQNSYIRLRNFFIMIYSLEILNIWMISLKRTTWNYFIQDDTMYACKICNCTYLGQGGLKRHMRLSHKEENAQEKAPCNICGKMIAKNGELKWRISCNIVFFFQSSLSYHKWWQLRNYHNNYHNFGYYDIIICF